MGAETKIEWCHHTFNPWIGCTKVAPGCTHCYAEADMDKRRGRVKWGPHGTRSKTSADYWRQPLKWEREAVAAGERRRVFCGSLCDVCEDWDGTVLDGHGRSLYRCADGVTIPYPSVPPRMLRLDHLRRDLFALIDQTPHLDWLLLTKRPENVRRMWPMVREAILPDVDPGEWFRPSVWLGTSVSDEQTADVAIPRLLACRDLAPVLFLSVEPLLGPVDLRSVRYEDISEIDALTGTHGVYRPHRGRGPAIGWVIVGGESGANARPCDVAWIRSLVRQCREAGVPCFVKQMGARPYVSDRAEWGADARINTDGIVRLQDHKGGDPAEWPEDLRVRELPRSAARRLAAKEATVERDIAASEVAAWHDRPTGPGWWLFHDLDVLQVMLRRLGALQYTDWPKEPYVRCYGPIPEDK